MSLFDNFLRNRNAPSNNSNNTNSTDSSTFSLESLSLDIGRRIDSTYHASSVYLSSWVNSCSYFREQDVIEALEPLVKSVKKYSSHGRDALLMLHVKAVETEKAILDLIGQSDLDISYRPTSIMGEVGRNISETLKIGVSYLAEKTEGAVDYLGDNILGSGAYRSLKARVSSYTRLIQNLFSSFTTSFEARQQNKLNAKENERRNQNRLKYLNESSTVSSLENEAKKAKDHVSNLIIELDHFLSRNEVYLKKNILDKTEDGIQKNRPDVVRQELTHFQRPIFDPFPSQYVREHVLSKKDKIA